MATVAQKSKLFSTSVVYEVHFGSCGSKVATVKYNAQLSGSKVAALYGFVHAAHFGATCFLMASIGGVLFTPASVYKVS